MDAQDGEMDKLLSALIQDPDTDINVGLVRLLLDFGTDAKREIFRTTGRRWGWTTVPASCGEMTCYTRTCVKRT